MTQLQVRLYRDSFSRPWGFRLQGGRDIGYPLTIQRVFSNSPAEGELQRGDRVLSLGGHPGSQLTHQQAQDIVKGAHGQIDVAVERPPPSRVSSIATFTPAAQRPRAQSLQPQSLQPLTMPGQSGLRLNANPCYNPNFIQQFSPSSPHPPPPWTHQQAPKKVSKLSELGGGAPDFGVDYGSPYGTVPRRRHSSQVHSYAPHSQYAGHSPSGAYGLSFLGRQNFDFGTDYCTLPRTRIRQSSQPPRDYQPFTMPVSRGSTGFSPKKVTLSRLGGGGPEFGSDFTRYRPSSSFMQPMHVHTGSRGPHGPSQQYTSSADIVMGMDNLNLSPRTPEFGYQAPPLASSAGGGQYIPTGVRLDMEREQELRQQQQQQQQQQPQQQYQDYQPVSPQPAQQMYYFEPQPAYVPTGVRLDHQMGEEEAQGELPPVRERRKAFMNAPARHVPAATGKSTAPKVPRPRPGSTGYSFGVDYTKPAPKTSTVTWRPQSAAAQRPVNVPPPQPEVQSAPVPWSQNQPDEVDQHVPPAWRTTLKSTGVKPWDKDLEYTAGQQESRSVGYQQAPRAPKAPVQHHPPAPAPAPPLPQQGGGQEGPQVLHLQYNSPMSLYSKENIRDTFAGQTKAMAAAGAIPPSSTQVQNPEKAGDRDWTQSAVYRMIYEEEHRGRPSGAPKPQQQQHQQPQPQPQQQQPKGPPPPPAPKPRAQTFQQAFTPMDGEYGTSDF